MYKYSNNIAHAFPPTTCLKNLIEKFWTPNLLRNEFLIGIPRRVHTRLVTSVTFKTCLIKSIMEVTFYTPIFFFFFLRDDNAPISFYVYGYLVCFQ